MCGLRVSAPPAVRGSGVSSRFHLSRGSSSCNLAARCHRLSLLASSSCSRCLVIAPLSSPLPCRLRPFLSPVFLCGFLSFPSPFLRLAGRGVLCLLAYALWLSFLSPCSPSVSCPLRLLATGIILARSRRRLSHHRLMRSLVSCLLLCAPRLIVSRRLLFVLSPRFSTSVGGEASARYLLACPCFRRAGGGRCRRDSVGGAGLLLACLGWRAGDAVLSAVVVSGLCCRCLYI